MVRRFFRRSIMRASVLIAAAAPTVFQMTCDLSSIY